MSVRQAASLSVRFNEVYLSDRESAKRSNEIQGATVSVRFSEASVEREPTLYREPRFTDTVTGSL